jgi:hypothetical protein
MIVTDNSKVIQELKERIAKIKKLIQYSSISDEAREKLQFDLDKYEQDLKVLEKV